MFRLKITKDSGLRFLKLFQVSYKLFLLLTHLVIQFINLVQMSSLNLFHLICVECLYLFKI
jgi:hypothetical protein